MTSRCARSTPFVAAGNGGVAAAGEVRLPTGDEQNLLGAGSTSYRLMGVGSLEHGPGLAARQRRDRSWRRLGRDDLRRRAAVAAHPRLTLSGELLGRHVSQLHDIDLAAAPHPTIAGVDTLRLVAGDTATTLANAVAGVKWNVGGTLVIGGHIVVPARQARAHRGLTPTFGLEYAF